MTQSTDKPIPICHRCGTLLESELAAAEAALAEAQQELSRLRVLDGSTFKSVRERAEKELTLTKERDKLQQQVTQQAAELDKWREREASVCPEDYGFEEVITQQAATIAELREWLGRYGKHENTCQGWKLHKIPCTCGLDAALAHTGEPK